MNAFALAQDSKLRKISLPPSHMVPNSSLLFMSNVSCPCRCKWENGEIDRLKRDRLLNYFNT
jgi:hypothetical protein